MQPTSSEPTEADRMDSGARSAAGSGRSWRRRRSSARHRTPFAYRLADHATEILLYLMLVFSPWAFGTTQPWAIWIMNGAGYGLGLLWLLKRILRWTTGYRPARWGQEDRSWITVTLALLTGLILLWSLTSAVNARAWFLPDEMRFEYRDGFVAWLPHSYDAPSSWNAFFQYLALACTFWALRDWILGKTRHERHHGDDEEDHRPGTAEPALPARLQRLLWVLCLNGALLALEGILQRMSGTNRLLWLIEPRHIKEAFGQFGPYAYRSNAAQYLNLVWPVCFGFWWLLRRRVRHGDAALRRWGASPHILLVPCLAATALAPVVSGSRGGALVALVLALGSGVAVALGSSTRRARARNLMLALLLPAIGGGVVLGYQPLRDRLFAPRFSYATGRVEVRDFTLRASFHVPETIPEGTSLGVLGLSSSTDRLVRTPRWAMLSLDANGLAFTMQEGRYELRAIKRARGFVTEYGGQLVDVVVVRDTNACLYVNGKRLPTADQSWKDAGWNEAVPAAYLWVGAYAAIAQEKIECNSATLFDRALTETEVAALGRSDGTSALDTADREVDEDLPEDLPEPVLELDREVLSQNATLRDQVGGRLGIFDRARVMAREYPWLGSGPGTFGPLFHLYRTDLQESWQWYAHNDWLETRITFGRLGSALVAAALVLALATGLRTDGISLPWPFRIVCLLALGGCLGHALFDFPFQIHSVLFLFLTLTCLWMTTSFRR